MSTLTALPVLTRAQCAKLRRRIAKLPVEAPNSMNRYGAVLSGPEWQPFIDKLVAKHVAPIAQRVHGIRLAKRGHYAFVVRYDVTKQKSLAKHVDTSDMTLNVCLGGSFLGGDVVFDGGFTASHAVGRGIVHSGKLAHRATALKSGTRVNLIV